MKTQPLFPKRAQLKGLNWALSFFATASMI